MLDENEKASILSILTEYKGKGLFASSYADLGKSNVVEHTIELIAHAKPKKLRPFNIPHHLLPKVHSLINELLEHGLIEPSTGPTFVSPAVIVAKKNGDIRLCCDYRHLNSCTVKTQQLMPTLSDVARIGAGKKFMTTLDLSSGYWQVKMGEEAKAHTAFVMPGNMVCQWRVMPFGLTGAPATFQRLMNAVLADLIAAGKVVVYIDDILLMSATFDEHVDLMRTVFDILIRHGLRLKLSKVAICQPELLYLGHILSEEGFRPSKENVEKLTNFPRPKNVKEIQRLVGLLSFYRRHVKNFARIARPLTELTKKDLDFVWGEGQQQAMDSLIRTIASEPVLRFPVLDGSKTFKLTCDASAVAIGSVLSQEYEGIDHPIAFFSRALTDTQRAWSSTHQELYALVASLAHFREYLIGVHFQVVTDNSACTYILTKPNLAPKLTRWALAIQEYDFDIVHIEGKSNVVADALSRARPEPIVVNALEAKLENPTDLAKLQMEDEHIRVLIQYIRSGVIPEDMSRTQRTRLENESVKFKVQEGVLYRLATPYAIVVIPANLRLFIMREHHSTPLAMHMGIRRTYESIARKCWWAGMRSDIERYVKECSSCGEVKPPGKIQRPALQPIIAKYPMEIVSTDICGPFPRSRKGNKYAVIFICGFSRYCEILPLKDQTAESLADVFVNQFVTRYGVCEKLLSDQGANYMSDLMNRINRKLGIKRLRTSAYHPACNGKAERTWRVVKACIAHFVNDAQDNWCQYLPFIRLASNAAWHRSINTSPAKVFFGRELRLPVDLLLPRDANQLPECESADDFASQLTSLIKQVWEEARKYGYLSAQEQKRYFDAKGVHVNIKVGDRVYKHTPRGQLGNATKLLHHYEGPFEVLELGRANAKAEAILWG